MVALGQTPRCRPIRRPFAIALLCILALSTACSTKVGKNANPAPTAVITPVGAQAVAGAGTAAVAITVRSGSAVVLSGKDSDGNGTALASFTWNQTGGPMLQVPPIGGTLLNVTSSTIEFTAPQVASDTALTFTLSVTNALGVSATATAKVTVTAANDPDEFLVPKVVDNPSPPRRFVVAVAPSSQALTPDTPVCVSVNRTVSYTSRGNGPVSVSLPPLANLQANAVWNTAVSAVGAGGGQAQLLAALQSTTNPRVVFDVPAFNDLELATMFNQAASVNQQLVTSDLDSAVLNLSISATPGACNGMAPDPATVSGSTLALGVYAPGATTLALAPGTTTPVTNGGSGPLNLTADALLQAVNPAKASPAETLSGARAYYAANDPAWAGAPKTDLNTWLDANCFDSTQGDFGTGAAGANGAHAVYTNNYDLGFGRDMYFIKCAANHQDAHGNITAYAGDMAAVVINYGSLEQAALKQAPILAVAMEYQGAGHSNCHAGSNPCLVKFYAFAPDDRTGLYQRVSSANFDRRGEKYIPGACLSCHGGAITDATFQTAGSENVDATFMPWDVGALLFSDTDPAFLGNLISKTSYTSAVQEPNLLNLNALVWQTYQTPELVLPAGGACTGASCVNRLAAPIALLTKWYQWCNTANSQDPRNCPTARPYDDSGPPSSGDWPTATPTGASTTPTGAPNDLYHAVYAHHCRSCHTQNNVVNKQFNTFKTFEGYFEGKVGPAANGIPNLVFNFARMPLARLTQDRFWVDFYGSQSAAQRLAQYINSDPNATFPNGALQLGMNASADAAGNTVVSPGAPVMMASVLEDVDTTGPTPDSPAAGTNSYTVNRFGGARVDLSSSLFTASYQSALTEAGDTALIGANNGSPAFSTSLAGAYLLTVTPTSASSKTASPAAYTFKVNATPPTISAACQSISVSAAVGTLKDVPLAVSSSCITLGLEPPNSNYNALQFQHPPGNSCQNAVSSAWASTPVVDAAGTWTATLSTSETYGVTLTFGSSATANESVTLCYRITDVDGSDPQGAITFTLSDTLTAASPLVPIPVGPPPVASYWITAPTLTATDSIVPADPGVTLVLSSGAATALAGAIAPALATNPPATTTKPPATTCTAPATSTSIGLTGCFQYSPPYPTFLTCDINGNDLATGTHSCAASNNVYYDSFLYYLKPSVGTTTSNVATVYLNIQATASFSRATTNANNVYTILSSNCSSCHFSTTTAVAGDPSYYWQATGAVGTTYASITGTNSAGSSGCNNWTNCQYDISASTSSSVGYTNQASLYFNPCDPTSFHFQNYFPGSASDPVPGFCPNILQWVLEGGHND